MGFPVATRFQRPQASRVGDATKDSEQVPGECSGWLVQDPPRDVMVTSAQDIILRKMLWYREGNEVSDRQWSDSLGVVKAQGERLDQDYL